MGSKVLIYRRDEGRETLHVHQFNNDEEPDQPEDKKNFNIDAVGKKGEDSENHQPDDQCDGCDDLLFDL